MTTTNDDLIWRAAAIAEVEEYLQEFDSCISEPDLKLDGYRNGLQVAIQELKALTAVDAVPVVRCKDCVFYNTVCCTDGCGWCEIAETGVNDNFFCAAGERRDSE